MADEISEGFYNALRPREKIFKEDEKIINIRDYVPRDPFFLTNTNFYISLIKAQSEIFSGETPGKGKVKYTNTARRKEENNKADFLP